MKLKFRFSLIAIMLVSISLFSQDGYELSGTITDTANDPLPGVNVIIESTSRGSTTDFDGKFQLVVNSGEVVEFSSLGYITQSIAITDQTELTIVLEEDSNVLDEVVVVGYGSIKKSDITGATSSVKSEELTAFPVLDAAQALQGRAAGVVVQSNNGGEPGAPISITIRGNTSINASSNPLIVVDGFVGADMPQTNDIASMEILKDASATAIYGSRGSNGVILVSTKKGKSGKSTVELNLNYSVQNTANSLDLLNVDQFTTYQQAINPSYVQGTENTDWQDLIYRQGNVQDYQLSFSGGTDKINYYASGNYYNQEGVVINSGFTKITFLSNVEAQVSDKVKLGLNLFGSRGDKSGVSTQSTGDSANGGGDDVISLAMRFDPSLGVKDANGLNTVQSQVGDNIDNPYAVATERDNDTKNDNFRANAFLDWDIIKGLNFKTTFGFNTINQTQGTYEPSTLITTAGAAGGRARINSYKRTNALSENYLTYKTELGKGNLTLLGGYSYQQNITERYSTGVEGLTSDSFSYYNLAGGSTFLTPTSSFSEVEVQSLFARLNYDWDDKYLLTATVRRDGASNFAANYKYATFPSGAFGWKISNEEFLMNSNTVSNLKLRLSYGVTGNPSIQPYQSLASFETIYAVTNGQTVNAITPLQPANPDLKWETSYQGNVGVDLGLFDNALSLQLDYYNIDTKDLILGNTGLPEYFGFLEPEILTNLGEINNRGFEITINARIINNDNFTWNADFNWSKNKSKVVALIDGADIYYDASPSYFNIPRTHILREGEEVGLFWGYEYQGVYQGGALPAGTATISSDSDAGGQLFTDIDGNGEITTEDQTTIGNPNADWNFGFTNNFTYKDFDLNIFWQGSQGGEIMNLTNVQLFNGDANSTTEVLNSWTPTNTNTNVPSAKLRGKEITSRFVEDGSYVRLKNIALGYNLPSDILENSGIERVRFTISAQNLLTFTNYSGLDPEVNYFADQEGSQASNTTQGFDYGNYPTVRGVNFSLNLTF